MKKDKKVVRKKLKAVEKRSAQQKCEEMFQELHIASDIGNSAIRALTKEMKSSLKPMGALADNAVEYFKDKMDDEHTSILLAVFALVFSRTLFDPSIASLTMTEKKGGDSGHTDRIIKP